MLARFSLYGFLKNQRYYEPFMILLFLERGFSFTQIGILVAFREIWINLFEVPSGALADMYGRRRCMILTFSVLSEYMPISSLPCFSSPSARHFGPVPTRP